ncbi:MAG: hypothetical protein CME06_05625 [Gemmatimonadetes bacterium]|nr:hypothetical protein [Gemmatimonadota bacterium]
MGTAILFLALGFVASVGVTMLNMNRVRSDATHAHVSAYEDHVARDCARSGAHLALRNLMEDADWRDGYQDTNLATGAFSATIDDAGTDGTLAYNEIRITSQGDFAGADQTIVAMLERRAFSHYAYFTGYEPQIWFITGDTIQGPVHTNGQFHIWGGPVFQGHVTSVAEDYATWRGYHFPDFQEGVEFGVPPIELPVDLEMTETAAQQGGHTFYEETWLNFTEDGDVEWATEGGANGTWSLSGFNGVIYVDGGYDVHVEGVVDGDVTVATEGRISIDADLTYASDPRINPASDDFAGLIAWQDVYVADTAPNQNNCNVHASIMAVEGSFYVENYSQGSPRGVLGVLGGVIQQQRGAVGTFNRYGIVSGYQKKYIYDERLMESAPPAFPVIDRPVLVTWAE